MGLETTKGSSCRGPMYLCPALRMLICGRQTTRVPGMEAWLWYQLRTVPGMSPQMMVPGEGRLSFGRNMQQDWSSNCGGERKVRSTSLTNTETKLIFGCCWILEVSQPFYRKCNTFYNFWDSLLKCIPSWSLFKRLVPTTLCHTHLFTNKGKFTSH